MFLWILFLNTFAGEVVITSAVCKTAPLIHSNSPRWSTTCVVAEAGGLTHVEACFLVAVLVTSLVTQELIRSLGSSGSTSVQTLGMIPRTVLSERQVEQSLFFFFFSKSQFHLVHRALEILCHAPCLLRGLNSSKATAPPCARACAAACGKCVCPCSYD